MGKILAAIGIVVAAGALLVWKMTNKSEPTEAMTPLDKGMSGTDMKATEKKLSTKTSYKNPGGEDEVGFNVTVNSQGVVVDATTDVLAVNAISKTRQLSFSQGMAAALKGKNLSELTAIDRVGGSSLTTGAFNASLTELKAQL